MIRKTLVGNWKMNGLRAALEQAQTLVGHLQTVPPLIENVVICPPFTLIQSIQKIFMGSSLSVGGQNCHHEKSGAYTGEISAEMLHNLGATHVILGHSERRTQMAETDALVAQKICAAVDSNLIPIICIGETLQERDAGLTQARILEQLTRSLPSLLTNTQQWLVAYEPVWAIGTGLTPTPDSIITVHRLIRDYLVAHYPGGAAIPILYGGSVNTRNAGALLALPEVGGLLVGGASLLAETFLTIVQAAA